MRLLGCLLAGVLVLALGGVWLVVDRAATTLRQVRRAQDVRQRVSPTTARLTEGPAATAMAPHRPAPTATRGPTAHAPAPVATILPTATSCPQAALVQQPFTLLVLGIDQRPTESVTSIRADTLLLVRVDPHTPRVALLSIPRDTFVQIPRASCGGMQKNNAACACGFHHPEAYRADVAPSDAAAALAAETVESFLGVRVDYTAQVEFAGFVRLIDALGGITVDVPARIIDPAYPRADGTTARVVFQAGVQRMDGATALRYTCTRHADSDFGRAHRQQQVVVATLNALRRNGLWAQMRSGNRLLEIVGDSVQTTLPVTDLRTVRALATLAAGLAPEQVERFLLEPETHSDGTRNFCLVNGTAIQWNQRYVDRIVEQWLLPPEAVAGATGGP